jgi:glycosyl transferase family 2
MPRVSVIVPNYNYASYLRLRMDTVLGQTYQDFEVILMDDCSTDESRSILQEYAKDPRVRLEFNEKNSGNTFRQWNKGVRLARGEYVWIAESDDYAHERLLERLVGVLDAEPEVTFAYCRSWRVCEGQPDTLADDYLDWIDSRHWKADFLADGREECRKYFVRKNPVPNASAVVFRRAAYEEVGGADETLVLCGDWKLWAMLALAGKVAYLAEPLNHFRFHEASVRSKMGRMGVDAAEGLQAIGPILNGLTLSEPELVAVYKAHAIGWVPQLMSTRVPLSAKAVILRQVRAFDPNPLRRVAGPALDTVRQSLRRRWRDFRSSIAPAGT